MSSGMKRLPGADADPAWFSYQITALLPENFTGPHRRGDRQVSEGSAAAGSAPIGKILADDGNGHNDPGYRLRFLSGCDALRLQAVPIETREDSGGKA
jgi:hypothetical protein